MLAPANYDNYVHGWQHARQMTDRMHNYTGCYIQWLVEHRFKIVSRYDYWHRGAQAQYQAVFNLHTLVQKALAPC